MNIDLFCNGSIACAKKAQQISDNVRDILSNFLIIIIMHYWSFWSK
ncbi:hypothetical protein PMAN_a3004 [Pseudoalteromonas marina]|nr:hypothetical protein PMAN_a3004 [Pseudoalteromonas marina]